MRTAIYGAGSLGTVLGAYLSRNGISVDLFSRNRAHIEALRENGAHVIGKADFTASVSAFTPDEMAGFYDIIILMTKSVGNDGTIRFLMQHLAPEGLLCTCQNGLPEPGIAAIIGEERTCGCTIGWGATYISPGISELTSGEDTFTFTIGRMDGKSTPMMEALRDILSNMGSAEIDEGFAGARWSKLLINASFSAVSAVTGMTFGGVSSSWRSRRIVQLIMKECVDVSRALGIRLAPMQGKDVALIADYHSLPKRLLSFIIIPLAMRNHRSLKSSMLQDIEKGKETEIDAVDGALSREGRRAGVPTPVTDRTIEIVRMISDGRLRPSMENLGLYEA